MAAGADRLPPVGFSPLPSKQDFLSLALHSLQGVVGTTRETFDEGLRATLEGGL